MSEVTLYSPGRGGKSVMTIYIYMYLYLSLYLSIYIYMYLYIYIYIYVYICIYIYIYIYIFIYIYMYIYVCLCRYILCQRLGSDFDALFAGTPRPCRRQHTGLEHPLLLIAYPYIACGLGGGHPSGLLDFCAGGKTVVSARG